MPPPRSATYERLRHYSAKRMRVSPEERSDSERKESECRA
jgi:hypothetical protein